MFFLIKMLLLLFILLLSTTIGYMVAYRYSRRVAELEEFNTALELFETKITYTYDDLIDAFMYLSEHLKTKMYRLFFITAEKLRESVDISAGDTFRRVVEEEKIFLELNPNDIEIVKSLSISLGQVDLESQIKNIHMVQKLVEKELTDAYEEKRKNFKLYRHLGMMGGMMLVILLI